MDAQIEKKMDINNSINHNLEDSAVVALTLLRSGVLDNIKATEEDPTLVRLCVPVPFLLKLLLSRSSTPPFWASTAIQLHLILLPKIHLSSHN